MSKKMLLSECVGFYKSIEPKLIDFDGDDAMMALRIFGKGPPFVLVHGYPVHGLTWAKLLPELSTRFTCFVVDLPGLGDSKWTRKTNFSFTAQIKRLENLLLRFIHEPFVMMAHDTGATLARMVAAKNPGIVSKLMIINTEMPGHRPPWIQFYQFLAKFPGALLGFHLSMGSKLFIRSNMGLGQFYHDRKLLNDYTNVAPYIDPLLASKEKMFGAIAYLQGIEWKVVDNLAEVHKQLTMDVLFLWGKEDKTFPIDLGRAMAEQFGGLIRFVGIQKASLMPHEERPEEVITHIYDFLGIKKTSAMYTPKAALEK